MIVPDIQKIDSEIKQWVGSQPWLDQVADPVQKATTQTYHRLGTAGQRIADFFNGIWLGHPVHPVVTDITIGALTSAVTLDLLEKTSDRKGFGAGADASLMLGVGTGLVAAVAGLTDWQHTQGEARRTGIMHALLNTAGMALYVISLFLRGKGKRPAGRRLALTGYLLSVAAAFLGGDLVYRQKIGVNHTPIKSLPEDFLDVMAVEELEEGQLVRREIQGVPILLFKQGPRVFAINEVCAHMGGPLSEGVLHSDNSVSCPWHGSRFDLETGRVLNGPSAYSQTCYETQVINGRILIRPDMARKNLAG